MNEELNELRNSLEDEADGASPPAVPDEDTDVESDEEAEEGPPGGLSAFAEELRFTPRLDLADEGSDEDMAPPERKLTVGQTLVAERRRQGKSSYDVESATRIMGRMIAALEEDRFDDLPAPVYVKGYISSYAKFLGMDVEPLLRQYLAESGADVPGPVRLPEPMQVNHDHAIPQLPLKTWLIVGGAVIGLIIVLWVIGKLVSGPETPTVPTAGSQVTDEVSPGITTTTTVVDGRPFTLEVAVEEGAATSVVVLIDGLTAYDGELTGGQPKEWVVTSEATVEVDDPAVVTVSRDGTAVALTTTDDDGGTVTLRTSD